MYHLIKYKVGNGSRVFLWHDNWHPLSPILGHFGPRILYNSSLSVNAKLDNVIQGRHWRWPHARSHQFLELRASIPSEVCPDENKDDVVV